jgi:hypothetical protein
MKAQTNPAKPSDSATQWGNHSKAAAVPKKMSIAIAPNKTR